jgi:hypothetical protein
MSSIGSDEPLLLRKVGMGTDGKQPQSDRPHGLKNDLRVAMVSPPPIILSVSDDLQVPYSHISFLARSGW